ncbi:MAG: class II fructose-bisphosphatase [Candidatus Fermentithermobacillus carboniphilus]|uniref:Fructose-1,6-bisphosphatase n=1 Tax=Candidatus Fermentithermobacillus carboniphilus TaxID=3085328 RepID=A0AAT9LF46_9FIRM|nr:MAG: class II fructose-bisphosphatase [Candidatus Fermentithermobacillus carboniphilus]
MVRELALEFVRVTEAGALACGRLMGMGDKEACDDAAVKAMRAALETVDIDGTVVIGEGEMDEAPMLYIGEKVGTGRGPKVDVAVDPLEGTTVLSKGLPRSMTVIAVAEEGCLFHAPDMYMEKLAVGPKARGVIDLDAPMEDNLKRIAKCLGKNVSDLVVVILDRPRNESLIASVRKAGARIKLIPDGDLSPAVAVAFEDSGVDVLAGIGGAPEGVLAAAALRCVGGEMQARLWPTSSSEVERAKSMGIQDIRRKLLMDDLVKGDDVIFAATGVTDGELLDGVRYIGPIAKTHSLVMRGTTGTIRFIRAVHRLDKKPRYVNVRESGTP